MAADTAALVVALSAQLTKFEKDMKKATGIADNEVKKIENRFSRMNIQAGGFDQLASTIGKLATVTGITALIGQIANLNKAVADIGEGAERVGLTTDAFQKFRFAVVATGGTLESADAGLERFAREMSEAAKGSNEMAKFLRLNNVAITDSKGTLLPLNQLLEKYAELVRNAETPADQLRLAVDAFGRQAGPQMVEVLRGGATGLREFGREADAAGVVLDKALIERAKVASDKFNVLKLQVETFFKEAAVAAAQVLKEGGRTELERNERVAQDWATFWKEKWNEIVKHIETHAPDLIRMFGNFQDVVTNQIITGAEELARTRRTGGAEVAAPLTGAGLLGREDVRRSLAPPTVGGDASTRMLRDQDEALKKLIESQEKRIALLDVEAQTVGKTIGEQTELKTEIELQNDALEKNIALTPAVIARIQELAIATGRAAQAAEDAKNKWRGMNEAVQFAGNQMIDIMIGLTQKTLTAAEAMRQLTQALIKALLQAALLGQGPLGNLLGFGAAAPGGTGGLLGALIPRQGGGSVSMGRPYVVGEKGPELFIPKSSGRIEPHSISRGGAAGGAVIEINNYVAADTETTQRREGGGPSPERIVIDIVKKAAARGELDDVNRGRFGLRPQKVR